MQYLNESTEVWETVANRRDVSCHGNSTEEESMTPISPPFSVFGEWVALVNSTLERSEGVNGVNESYAADVDDDDDDGGDDDDDDEHDGGGGDGDDG